VALLSRWRGEREQDKARGETNGRLVDPSIRVVSGSANRHGRPPPGLVPFIDQAPAGRGRPLREDREMLVDPLSLRVRSSPPPVLPRTYANAGPRSVQRSANYPRATWNLEPCAHETADLSLEDSLKDHVSGRKSTKGSGSEIESIGHRLSCARGEIGFGYRAGSLRISGV